MKLDKKSYRNRKEKQIGITAYHTSRPNKVLFFADTFFLFCQSTLHTLASPTSQPSNQSLPKSAIFTKHFYNKDKYFN